MLRTGPSSGEPGPLLLQTTALGRLDFSSGRAWAQWLRGIGVFPDQGLNPCLLRWQVDSLPPSRQGSPLSFIFNRGR